MSINKTLAKSLLEKLYLIRIVDEELAKVYPTDVIKCPIHLSTGSEAVSVGVCAALKKADRIIGGHRSHGIYLAKGGSLTEFMTELYGGEAGCSGGKGGSMHLISLETGLLGTTPILGATIPIGVGSALTSSIKKDKKVTAVFFGDGASEEGVFYESLNLAGLFALPVVFVCENNKYSIFQEQKVRQPLDNIYKKAELFGFPGVRVDGNDVLAVYEAASVAVRHARKKGPYLIECVTNRWRQHVGCYYDHEIGFGTKAELEELMTKSDPITNFENYLKRKRLLSGTEVSRISAKVAKNVASAFDFAQQAAPPSHTKLHEAIY
ncbi:thiamine pyrophosphate-dependent dehydrogenase E1 component subunit alpha [Patescibacteria group bacterium]|nr:thiamine pyrophosphate-dependent dehydrogenase E1 component subunit alpha [Patescibacteria group bacterium]MBU1970213.1 thiamine pyrophosphate-dependent dehydrogenase E1 component subunit alpha [Patescibacteria group bacterium]